MNYFARLPEWLSAHWPSMFRRRRRCFPRAVRKLFKRWKQTALLESLEDAHSMLLKRRVTAIYYGDPSKLTPKKQCAANCKLLQQALLHRAERLLASAGTALLENNVYGLALNVRGFLECAAVLGYFCHRLVSLADGNIKFEDFELNVADAVMGAKHETFSEARDPENILTCFEKADKYLNKNFFEGQKDVLRDAYDWLSEFAHPNFLSNFSAFSLDKRQHQMVLRHGEQIRKEDFQLAEYLDVGALVFVVLLDAFSERLSEVGLVAQFGS
jgi:hypothetical protein